MLLLFALAVGVPSLTAELLAAATLAAAAWIACDGLVDDRPGPRARLVMAFGLAMLAALPALLLAFDHRLWIAPPPLRGLNAGLALWSVGIAAIALGSRMAGVAARRRNPATPTAAIPAPSERGRLAVATVAVIVLVCLVAFVHEVGGPVAYLKNLNNSAAANAGLTYLIWGISFAKYASFAYLGESWASGRRPSQRLIVATAVAILLLLFLGSRLLVLVAVIQLLLLYAALRPMDRRFKLAILTATIAGAVVFIGLGEYRRWENVPTPRPSFPSYFANTSLPNLPRTYVNNYADAIRLSVLARAVVPRKAHYEDGKELLRILLQPIPGSIRPAVSTAPALLRAFTSGHKNGNALPVPVEGYIQFGFAGDVVICLLFGLAVGLIDRIAIARRDVGCLTATVAGATGLVIIFRGSLHTGIALAAIDVIGFLVVHRVLFRRSPSAATTSTASTEEPSALVSAP